MITVIAMPRFNETIAPRFETAGSFLICNLEDGRRISSHIQDSGGCEGFGRVRLLQDHHVNTLICSGIKAFYHELLVSSGITVIEAVDLTLDQAVEQFLAGALHPAEPDESLADLGCEIPHEDLVCWARELFESHGYHIQTSESEPPFPIDLVAELNCPLCHRIIRVAVCCGAHTYRSDQEIRELHHVTRTSFQARAYVYPAREAVRKRCLEYGIQVIDPDAEALNRDRVQPGQIPLLDHPIPGHERAFATGEQE
ncbi:MAG: hypothetical protein KKA42_04800 [candidate division Zixibacteria bacterium]|nr:hypothetical protein [candidate division Zixibacteria bacterium]